MKTLDNFFLEIDKKTTPLQRDEHLRRSIVQGLEVEGSAPLLAVDTGTIGLRGVSDSVWPRTVHIFHEGDQLRAQLLEYSKGDGVHVRLRPIGGKFHDGEDEKGRPVAFSEYSFQLVSIVRVYTRAQQEEKWRKEVEEKTRAVEAEKNKSRCFVATAAYGASDPRVALLQSYRDRVLATTVTGRLVVRFYYKISPRIGRFVDKSERRRSFVRAGLSVAVRLAQRQLGRLPPSDA